MFFHTLSPLHPQLCFLEATSAFLLHSTMKLLAGALLASILSASYAAAREASVYIFDASRNPSHSDLNPPSINPQTARLLLSHRLGVSQYHSLNDADEHTIRLLNNYGSKQQTLYTSNNDEDHSSDRKVLVVVEGVEHPEGVPSNAIIGAPLLAKETNTGLQRYLTPVQHSIYQLHRRHLQICN